MRPCVGYGSILTAGRKGILTEIWPELREKHGDFFVEPPLSPAMLHFVLSRNRGSRFYTLYQELAA
jgi:hypothetical protein